MGVQNKSAYRYTRLMPYVRRHSAALALILGLTLLVAAVTALMPWPLKILVDHALGDAGLPGFLNQLLDGFPPDQIPLLLVALASAASLALFVLNSILEVSTTWSWSVTGQRMVYDLAADLFYKLQRLSLLFHRKHPVGDSLGRLTVDSWCVFTATQSLLVTPAQNLFTMATIGVVAWSMDAGLTMLSLVLAPLLAISAVYFGDRLRRRAHRTREAQSGVMTFVHQTLTALPAVQAFGTEKRNRERFQNLSAHAVSRSRRSVLLRNSYGLINGLTMTAGAAIVIYAGGQKVLAGSLTVGSLLVFVAYLASLQGAVESLLNTYGNLKVVDANIDRVLDILDADDEVKESRDAVALAADRPAAGSIRFEAVSFAYEPGRPVLNDISLDVSYGETIALVGHTGAGKSTLVSLIPRFFDCSQGAVLVDGYDVRDLKLDSLREQISIVLQDPFLLPMSVAGNIAYGRPGAHRDDIIAAAVNANADEFIRRLPDGYDTVLAERGGTLSGGQKQRLAIARALLKDAPILILDEPTAALDTRTESLLLEALKRLMHGRTTIIIAHRLSTIRNADRILMLDGGVIVELGTHSELMRLNGRYAGFYAMQNPDAADEVLA